MIVRMLFPETKKMSADWTGKEKAAEQEAAAASIALESYDLQGKEWIHGWWRWKGSGTLRSYKSQRTSAGIGGMGYGEYIGIWGSL